MYATRGRPSRGSSLDSGIDKSRERGSDGNRHKAQDVPPLFLAAWNSSTAAYIWNNLAVSLINRTAENDRRNSHGEDRNIDDDSSSSRHNTTLKNARLFALLNLAVADAAIGCWDAKYTYVFWRPVTAIPEAAADGNAATAADPTWAPLFATPAHQEYPSGHSCRCQ